MFYFCVYRLLRTCDEHRGGGGGERTKSASTISLLSSSTSTTTTTNELNNNQHHRHHHHRDGRLCHHVQQHHHQHNSASSAVYQLKTAPNLTKPKAGGGRAAGGVSDQGCDKRDSPSGWRWWWGATSSVRSAAANSSFLAANIVFAQGTGLEQEKRRQAGWLTNYSLLFGTKSEGSDSDTLIV